MVCKQCKATPGSKMWSSHKEHLELTAVAHTYNGDHDERLVTDAGVFCSAKCLVEYLIQGKG